LANDLGSETWVSYGEIPQIAWVCGTTGVDSATYTIQIAIGEETGTACDGWPAALPATLSRIIERCNLDRAGLDGAVFLEALLLGIVLFDRGTHCDCSTEVVEGAGLLERVRMEGK
jgi:hypothetical protein